MLCQLFFLAALPPSLLCRLLCKLLCQPICPLLCQPLWQLLFQPCDTYFVSQFPTLPASFPVTLPASLSVTLPASLPVTLPACLPSRRRTLLDVWRWCGKLRWGLWRVWCVLNHHRAATVCPPVSIPRITIWRPEVRFDYGNTASKAFLVDNEVADTEYTVSVCSSLVGCFQAQSDGSISPVSWSLHSGCQKVR